MIAIVSSNPAEAAAFSALCDSRRWPHVTCASLRQLRELLSHTQPSVVLTRNKLTDGYSDDVLAALRTAGLLPTTRTIVLLAAGTPSACEARQVALGADAIQRDPVRLDVLVEYLARYRTVGAAERRHRPRQAEHRHFSFAGATICASDRTLEFNGRVAKLTPRELGFAEFLVERKDGVVSYHALYAELLGRRFPGETSNMRVLLGKFGRTLASVGIAIREWVEVIPKTGYRYHSTPVTTPPAHGGRKRRSA